jgi:hypothetical protein
MSRGRLVGGSRHLVAFSGRPCPRLTTGRSAFPQLRSQLMLVMMCAPSRIRTCAHGSGGNAFLTPMTSQMNCSYEGWGRTWYTDGFKCPGLSTAT